MISMSEDKKTAQVLIRLSVSERDRLDEEAKRQSRPAAQLARMLLMGSLDKGAPSARVAPSADEPREPHMTTFPVVALAAAGSGREVQLVPTGETVDVPNTLARKVQRGKLEMVRVVGDSMEPTFFDGDILAVESTRDMAKVKTRDVVFVRFNGDPHIKEIHLADKGRRITLMPRNTRHHSPLPVLESDTLELVGIVRDLAHRADAARKG